MYSELKMVLEIVKTSEVSLDGGLGKCKPIFVGDEIIKVGCDDIKISVINQNQKSQINSVFTGHENVISAIAVSRDGRILCSCSEDKIILWDLGPSKYTGGYDNKGVVIGENIGCCTHCAMSCSNKWLTLCILREIWIVYLSKNLFTPGNSDGFHCHAILKTDSSQINSCSFSSESEDLLVSVEDFNHFKVWNLLSSSLIYRSTTMVNSCISFCAFSGVPTKLLIGSTIGSIHVYNFDGKCVPAVCRTFNITEKDFMVGKDSNLGKANSEEQWVSNGCMIYSASICSEDRSCKDNDVSNADSKILTAKEMLASISSLGSILVSACNCGVILHSLKSCNCLGFVSFSDQRISDSLSSAVFYLIQYIILTGESIQNIQCCIKTASSQQKLYCIQLSYERSVNQFHKFASFKCGTHISFLSRSPLCNKSPLSYNVKLCEKHSYLSDTSKPGLSKIAKVKSSGYGKGPIVKMFCPITNATKNSNIHAKLQKITEVFHKNHINHEWNALNCGPPVNMEKNILICKTSGISGRVAYSEDGEYIGCSSISSQMCVLPSERLQLSRSINLAGHDSSINSLSFNLNSEWLISSSSDSTVRVWDWRNRECILKIDAERKSMSFDRREFSKDPIKQANFFYLDKFILMARNFQIDLCFHFLHQRKHGSDWHNEGAKYHIVKRIPFPTQQVTCFTAANQFHSHLVMAGCSNRDIMVYDLNHQSFLCTFKEAHTHRPPHKLVQFTGSTCPRIPAHTPNAYNLFLSASIKDGAKLWDLRMPKCIQKYDRHLSRLYASGIDISPCCRFVAACSEDKQVYIYDTRKCENYLYAISGCPDAVMDVAFSPCMTQLAAFSLNGHLLTFKSKL